VDQEGTVKGWTSSCFDRILFSEMWGVIQNFDTSYWFTDLAPGLNALREKIGHASVQQLVTLIMQRNMQTTSCQNQKNYTPSSPIRSK
jgi:hypothetical protein